MLSHLRSLGRSMKNTYRTVREQLRGLLVARRICKRSTSPWLMRKDLLEIAKCVFWSASQDPTEVKPAVHTFSKRHQKRQDMDGTHTFSSARSLLQMTGLGTCRQSKPS